MVQVKALQFWAIFKKCLNHVIRNVHLNPSKPVGILRIQILNSSAECNIDQFINQVDIMICHGATQDKT
uniref:Uncharacterized protein n=1 Tax=Oryza sativa subsp. japonica TaxID=39947 RepID=Q6ZF82_ORYSJ|nr:hypothetical protein [Oryza sativa Japonica Group]